MDGLGSLGSVYAYMAGWWRFGGQGNADGRGSRIFFLACEVLGVMVGNGDSGGGNGLDRLRLLPVR